MHAKEFVHVVAASPILGGSRGRRLKIISVCCPTTRLPENHVSRHSPPKDWKRKPRGREIFFGARHRAFFSRAECEFAYTNFRTFRRGKGYAASSIGVSILSSKLPLSFMATPSTPWSSYDKERRGGDIYARVRQGGRRVTGKRSEIRRIETNNRKQGPKGFWKDMKRALRIKTYRQICLSYNAHTWTLISALTNLELNSFLAKVWDLMSRSRT